MYDKNFSEKNWIDNKYTWKLTILWINSRNGDSRQLSFLRAEITRQEGKSHHDVYIYN